MVNTIVYGEATFHWARFETAVFKRHLQLKALWFAAQLHWSLHFKTPNFNLRHASGWMGGLKMKEHLYWKYKNGVTDWS